MNDAKINNNVYKASSEFTATGAMEVQISKEHAKDCARQIFKSAIEPYTNKGDNYSDEWMIDTLTEEILNLGSGTLILDINATPNDVVTIREDDEEE